jgi:hypothetical protein
MTLLPSFTRSIYSVEETMTTTIGSTQLFNGDPCLLREIRDEMKGGDGGEGEGEGEGEG